MKFRNVLTHLATLAIASAWPSPWPPTTPSTYSSNLTTIQPNPPNGHWLTSWTAMPQLTEFANLPPPPFNATDLVFFNSTIRQTIRVTTAGNQLRFRLSNAFGLNDLPITKVTIALPIAETGQNLTGASGINTTTLQTLTFSGNQSIVIPNAALTVSDPINFPTTPGQILSISLYLQTGQASNDITSHPGSRTSSWISFGDFTSSPNMTDPSTVDSFHWFFISALEVWTPPSQQLDGTFVVVGDSITDGRASYNNANGRWTDYLFNRLQTSPPTKEVAIANQAAGGNAVLAYGNGPNALSRIDRDVLATTGRKWAMLFEGVNDIGTADDNTYNTTLTAERLIQAYKQIVVRCHAEGIPVVGATITPFAAPVAPSEPTVYNTTLQPYSTPLRLAARNTVNDFIRNSGVFDAVVDFDAVVRDPENAEQLDPTYNSGDFLHPNELGYRAMADAFPVDIFGELAGNTPNFV